jgi:hypothetical protein
MKKPFAKRRKSIRMNRQITKSKGRCHGSAEKEKVSREKQTTPLA